eukprot:tig00020918_g15885.t1
MAVDFIALRTWLCLAACLRLLAVYLGFFNVQRFRSNLFSLRQDQVTDLYGRTFAIWTLVTCTLCVLCAIYIQSAGIFIATLASFALALVHFSTELLFFKTMTFVNALPTLIVAGVSVVWMSTHAIINASTFTPVHVKHF